MTPAEDASAPAGGSVPLNLIGSFGPLDVDVARARAEEEAASGNVEALTRLGGLAALEGDRAAARRWYEQAAELGDTDAMNNLGLLTRLDGDLEASERWHQKALKAFVFPPEDAALNTYDDWTLCAWSTYAWTIGDSYLRRFVRALGDHWPVATEATDRDIAPEEFEEMVEVLSSVGHPVALREAGKLEIQNNQDLAAARRLWKRAANKGDADAAQLLKRHWDAAGRRKASE